MTIDGLFLLGLILIGLAALALAADGGPRFRCADCAATFPEWELLVAHEQQHDACHCGPGRHHPSCELRRAAA